MKSFKWTCKLCKCATKVKLLPARGRCSFAGGRRSDISVAATPLQHPNCQGWKLISCAYFCDQSFNFLRHKISSTARKTKKGINTFRKTRTPLVQQAASCLPSPPDLSRSSPSRSALFRWEQPRHLYATLFTMRACPCSSSGCSHHPGSIFGLRVGCGDDEFFPDASQDELELGLSGNAICHHPNSNEQKGDHDCYCDWTQGSEKLVGLIYFIFPLREIRIWFKLI